MDDELTRNQPPMAKKERKFTPGTAMPTVLIGTAGVKGLQENKKTIKQTIKHVANARRRDRKED